MDHTTHTFSHLFEQLGLATSAEAIEDFIEQHGPLAESIELADAPFWNPSQAAFIRQSLHEDAEWAELVDQLNLSLRAG